jgi:tetratricopeptide (TPR) repeat protein
MAAHALAVDPDDAVRGKLRLSEGQISRINGISHRSVKELNAAVEQFTEAQRLMPNSPDPELGLARVYVYGLKDIDKAYAALQEAQKRGYPLGNREKLQLADGYMARADRLWWDSRNVRGLPQEKDQIQRAADDYKRALELYQGINATAGIVRVQNSLESVNFRLHQIESGEPAPGQDGALIQPGMPAAEILRRILRASKLIEQWQ